MTAVPDGLEPELGAPGPALDRIATARTEGKIPHLVGVLTAAGIDVIVLKGPVTRQRLYGPGEARLVSDVDLLVPPRSFRRAGRVLADDGFEMVDRSGHSDALHRPDVWVDLHLALPFTTVSPATAFEVLAAHRAALTVAGHVVPVLDEAAHVVHLALHAAQNTFDPDQRSMEEWRRGWASLSVTEAAVAGTVARSLGADATWALAQHALREPARGRVLAQDLPPRRFSWSSASIARFVRSPIPVRVRARVVEAALRHELSDEKLATWRDRRGLSPVIPGTAAGRWAKVTRLANSVLATARRTIHRST